MSQNKFSRNPKTVNAARSSQGTAGTDCGAGIFGPRAEVRPHNGSPALWVDGKPIPPMTHQGHYTNHQTRPGHMKALGESGIQVYVILCSLDWFRPGSFDGLRQQADFVLDNVPEACLILRVGLDPPAQWLKEHPEEVVLWNNGKPMKPLPRFVPEEYRSIGRYYSLASARWREDGGRALLEFIDQVEGEDFGRRVIGYFLGAGGTGEWYYPMGGSPTTDDLYMGNSPAFKSDFTRILKETYGTLDKLRASWNDSQATFDNPRIPNLDDRHFSRVDGRYFSSVIDDILSTYLDNPEEHITPPRHASSIGSFLNPDTHQFVADYYMAWNYATADSIIHFAHLIKDRTQNTKITGASYGESDTCSGVLRILNSGYVDLLGRPGSYQERQPGGVTAHHVMQDSFRLCNRMFIGEEDTRTHLSDEWNRNFTFMRTLEDSLAVMKRDFGRNLSEDLQAWWFDMSTGGWYDHPEIISLIKRQQELAERAYQLDRRTGAEITFLYDEQSTWYTSQRTMSDLCCTLRGLEIHRIGAPVAYHFHDDLSLENMPEYKLYVFLNTFALSDQERQAIDQRVKSTGKTALWVYTPGIINPDREPRFSLDYISELTGMRVGCQDKTVRPVCRIVDDGDGILAGVETDRDYGYFDREVFPYYRKETAFRAPEPAQSSLLYPCIYGDDPQSIIMARFRANALPALIVRDFGSWRSIHACFKAIRANLLRAMARYAGCHIYSESDDILYANQHFVTFHASTSGEKTIKLPKVSNPFEVYERKFYGNNTRQIQFTLEKGETKTFYLHGKI